MRLEINSERRSRRDDLSLTIVALELERSEMGDLFVCLFIWHNVSWLLSRRRQLGDYCYRGVKW